MHRWAKVNVRSEVASACMLLGCCSSRRPEASLAEVVFVLVVVKMSTVYCIATSTGHIPFASRMNGVGVSSLEYPTICGKFGWLYDNVSTYTKHSKMLGGY